METSITTTLFRPFNENRNRFSGVTEMNRYRALNFRCVAPFSDVGQILDWLFEATNMPLNLLSSEQQWICGVFNNANEYSISVGDVLQINDQYFVCKPAGWKEIQNFKETYDLD